MGTGTSLVALEPPPSPQPPARRPRTHAILFLAALVTTVLIGLGTFLAVIGKHVSSVHPSVAIGPVVFAEPWIETPLPIQIVSLDGSRGGSIRITGLPADAALSEGEAGHAGTWVVPLARLATLKIKAPPTEAAKTGLTFSLMSRTGEVVDEARSLLVVMPAWNIDSSGQPPAPSAPSPGAPSAGTKSSEPCSASVAPSKPQAGLRPASDETPPWGWPGVDEEARAIMRWGDEAMARGSVQAAQQIYEYAATQMRWPAAAFALAATHDPYELVRLAPLVAPDREKARTWYRRARDLSVARAEFYLRRLSTRP